MNYMDFPDITPSNMLQKCSVYTITQNITLNTRKPVLLSRTESSILKVILEHKEPLVVLLEYMNAKEKHIQKIADIYLNWGYNVLKVSLKSMQLLFPIKGSQVIAQDLANFLVTNESFSPLVIHGFSVGGYLWGETLVQFKKDLELYQSAIDRIKAQIFDSPADVNFISTALPAAVFPKSLFIKSIFEKFLWCYLKLRYEGATKFYINSRQTFTSGIIKAPTLFITSKDDNFSPVESVDQAYNEILEQKLEINEKEHLHE